MKFGCPHFRTGFALTALIAVLALSLAHLPWLCALGPLALALLCGVAARALLHVPRRQHLGIGFSARSLLRWGIVLIGVRLNFELLFHAGFRILFLAASVITVGLLFITWLGRRSGLPGMLPILLAVDSSICGASAVAAAAPVVRAHSRDIALVIPLCSLIGTAGMLGLTALQGIIGLAPSAFGTLAGATLHEVAQVIAAASVVPSALEAGTVTKLMKVALLAPAVLVLSLFFVERGEGAPAGVRRWRTVLSSVWFVFGFLLVALLHTFLPVLAPSWAGIVSEGGHYCFVIATFLMTMAMAGLGLQVDFGTLRENGLRTAGVAVAGWLVLVALAGLEIHILRL